MYLLVKSIIKRVTYNCKCLPDLFWHKKIIFTKINYFVKQKSTHKPILYGTISKVNGFVSSQSRRVSHYVISINITHKHLSRLTEKCCRKLITMTRKSGYRFLVQKTVVVLPLLSTVLQTYLVFHHLRSL
jgi:hypothetical protein